MTRQVYRPIDWAEEAERDDARHQPPPPRQTFVPAALPKIDMPAVRLADSAQAPAVVSPALVTSATAGTHQDRAAAWLRYALPLCGAFALVMLIVVVAMFRVNLFSWTALGVYFGVFVVAYAALLLRYWGDSPEGQAKAHGRSLWRFVETEQAHRLRIEDEAWELSKQEYQRRLEG